MTTEPLDAAYRAHADELTRYATALVGPDDARDVVADALLAALGEQQRAIVILTYWCDDTPATIAGILDVSEGSVRKQIARARAG